MKKKISIKNTEIKAEGSNIQIANIGVLEKENKETTEILIEIIKASISLQSHINALDKKNAILTKNIKHIENFLAGKKTSKSKLTEALKSIRNIAEGTVGSSVSAWIISAISKLI